MIDGDFRRALDDDGLFLPTIKRHSLEKISRHNRYASIFAGAMKKKWPQLAYVGLYSGPGRARVEGTGEIVETTAMSVLRQHQPFTHHIFVDDDVKCTDALTARIAALETTPNHVVLRGDANGIAPLVRAALPSFGPGHGLLSFCFVDPYAANLKIDTIRALSGLRMDFLVLLMLGWDARVNFRQYRDDPSSTRLAELVDCPTWRADYAASDDKNVVRFLLRKFDDAMVRLDYLRPKASHYHPVKVTGKGVMQYLLAFYTKNRLAQTFWEETLRGASSQLGLDLE